MKRFSAQTTKMSNEPLPDFVVWEPGLELQVDQPYLIGAITVVLEKMAGDVRKGVDAQGSAWECVLPAHYGYILDTVGGDGEELDVYVKPEDCDWSADIYVIDQLNLQTGNWDEHKIMCGFSSAQQAEACYIKAFSDEKGQDRLAATSTLSFDTFISWVYGGDTQSAISGQDIPDMTVRTTERGKDVIGDTVVKPSIPNTPVRFGAVPVQLAPTPTLSICDESDGDTLKYSVYLFGQITTYPNLRGAYNDLVRLLRAVPEQAEFNFYISSPGGDLLEAMRLASAMRNSRAKVITHAVGPVCSAAVILWAEGHEQTIGECAYFMQHMSSHGQWGKSTQIVQRASSIVHYVRTVVLKRQMEIGLWTEQEISDLVDKSQDLYITATEAKQRIETTQQGRQVTS